MRLVVLGGAGFIGSNFTRYVLRVLHDVQVLVYDKLTYAGRLENLNDIMGDKRFKFIRGDIADEEKLESTLREFQPDVVINFAAETHVDRSINEPAPFILTNILGVFYVLEVSRKLDIPLLIHTSTDEVYGDLRDSPSASEDSPLRPSSPYSASKASGDLLVQAYWRTYRLPVRIVRPCNVYGPYQHPEKLIPKTIIRAINNMPVPLYGGGHQVRDWLYVEDLSEALMVILERGSNGETYNIPGFNEKKNIEVVQNILDILGKPYTLIKVVEDRPGHDYRYSMRGDKILSLGWKPKTSWLDGLRRTVKWYLDNTWWWEPLIGDWYFTSDTPWREVKHSEGARNWR